MNYVYGYGRDSTSPAELTTQQQSDLCVQWFKDANLGPKWKYDGLYCDNAFDGNVDFFFRDMASSLALRFQKGDVLLTAKFNRICQRDMFEACRTMAGFHRVGVELIAIDTPSLNQNSATKAISDIQQRIDDAVTRYQREKTQKLRSDRTRAVPVGWKLDEQGIVPNLFQRKVIEEAVVWLSKTTAPEARMKLKKKYPFLHIPKDLGHWVAAANRGFALNEITVYNVNRRCGMQRAQKPDDSVIAAQ
jgi:hypothetical protein